MAQKHHPYHLVDPSPWPLAGAISALVTAIGLVLYMHGEGVLVSVIGLLMVVGTMFGWWRDVIKESNDNESHTPQVQFGLRLGMALFITSEVMFFVAFFWSFFNSSLFPSPEIGGVWPPKGITPINPFDLPYLNTLILLLSGTAVTWAHHEINNPEHHKMVLQGIGFTVLLGLIFTCVQAFEYAHAEFAFKENVFTSNFFMATGFHGLHVIIGTLFLLVCWLRARAGQFTPTAHVGFEAAAWYWHFVDVVWLFLFVCIYWWGSGL